MSFLWSIPAVYLLFLPNESYGLYGNYGLEQILWSANFQHVSNFVLFFTHFLRDGKDDIKKNLGIILFYTYVPYNEIIGCSVEWNDHTQTNFHDFGFFFAFIPPPQSMTGKKCFFQKWIKVLRQSYSALAY